MDAIVSARVPIALKERGNGILHDIGSTPTQLINAAYQFVLAEHELPKPHDPLGGMRGAKRELTDEQKEKVRRSLKAMYVGRPPQTSHSHVNSTPQGMSAMRVLLDTNALHRPLHTATSRGRHRPETAGDEGIRRCRTVGLGEIVHRRVLRTP